MNKGTRSGSGKIVQENFELLADIWGGSPATTALPFGVDGHSAQGTEEELDSQPLLDSTNESKLHVISCFSVMWIMWIFSRLFYCHMRTINASKSLGESIFVFHSGN